MTPSMSDALGGILFGSGLGVFFLGVHPGAALVTAGVLTWVAAWWEQR